ncbi:type II toxin-antitoxin system mRNA interferase toxin, RelE/StbE family [Enemella evansiae]|nr:type II toxin-antitoxin system mRNA interferase toxin, RelE/StbE family [Enemella evansiae]
MMVIWPPQAHDDRAAIWDHVVAEDPRAANRLDQLFSQAAADLAEFPALGRPGLIPGTRELFPATHYRLVYETRGDQIVILALVHTARRWPTP